MEQNKNPESIAIVLDGNRRYGKKLGLKPWMGHKFGVENVKNIIEWCQDLGIKELTLYSFSIDNFKRSEKEIKFLFNLFKRYIKELKNDKRVRDKGIRINYIGRLNMFPQEIQNEMYEVMEKTKKNNKFVVNFAMAYSGRAEITDALKKIIQKIKNKKIIEDDVDENLINDNLYLSSSPDILIRPGGEKRISDFLIWQSNYSELFFIKKLWPELTKEDLIKIIDEYKHRERRFGK